MKLLLLLLLSFTLEGYETDWGFLPILNERQEEQGKIFFVFHHEPSSETSAPRPITFCFNGGPGASSVWLHMGGVGPLKIDFLEKDHLKLVENPHTLLKWSDLVFVDPVMTGLSRLSQGVDPAPYLSAKGDSQSLGNFICQFLVKQRRWSSPIYLLGESYGGARIIQLASYLFKTKRCGVNGLIFISGLFNLDWIQPENDTNLPYLFYLPSYVAIHNLIEGKKSPSLEAVESFIENDFHQALFLGDALSEERKEKTKRNLIEWTGLTKEEIERANLRISPQLFIQNRYKDHVIGRFDGREIQEAPFQIRPHIYVEPSFHPLIPQFTQAIHLYLDKLGWRSDQETYVVISDEVHSKWNFEKEGGHFNLIPELRELLFQQPQLKIFAGAGLYDLAIPYYSTKYSLRQLLLPKSFQDRVYFEVFKGGHMFFLDPKESERLQKLLRPFYSPALTHK